MPAKKSSAKSSQKAAKVPTPREVVRRLFRDVFNKDRFSDLRLLTQFYAPNFRMIDPNLPTMLVESTGPEAAAACGGSLETIALTEDTSFRPKPRFKIVEEVAEGNKVAVSWTCTKGPVNSSGTTIYTVVRGKITLARNHMDVRGLVEQIGFFPLDIEES